MLVGQFDYTFIDSDLNALMFCYSFAIITMQTDNPLSYSRHAVPRTLLIACIDLFLHEFIRTPIK